MHVLLALAMVLHGAAHLVGVAESWQWSMTETVPYKTTVLNGRVELGLSGLRVAGLFWLLAALAFGLAAVGAVLHTEWWTRVATTTAVGSLVLSLVWWPESRIGVAVNVGLIATLAIGRHLQWL